MNLENRTLILAKNETTYGADIVPVAGSNAIEVFELATHSIEADKKERRAAMPYGGTLSPKNIATMQKISFKVFLKGSGTKGTPPSISPLLRSCRLSEAIVAGTSVSYERHSSKTEESCTIYYYEDGLLKKMTGCFGAVKADHTVNDWLALDFEFSGLYKPDFLSDAALPTPTYENTQPLIFESANFEYGAVTDLIFTKFSWDLGHEVIKRPDANSLNGVYGFFTRSANAPSGSFDPEVLTKSEFDPYTLAANSTENNISATVGSEDGNKVKIEFNKTVLGFPSTGAREGIKNYEIPFTAHVSNTAGNNEFKLTFL